MADWQWPKQLSTSNWNNGDTEKAGPPRGLAQHSDRICDPTMKPIQPPSQTRKHGNLIRVVLGLTAAFVLSGAAFAVWSLTSSDPDKPHVLPHGLKPARTVARGLDVLHARQWSAQEYEHMAKVTQQRHVTVLTDSYQTTVVEVDPLPAYVCVYGGSQDFVSDVLARGVQWEYLELQEIDWALQLPLPSGTPPTSTVGPALFVDVGANLGAFSISLAARGYEVISFEGMNANQHMLRSAMCMSNAKLSQRMTLHAMGVGASKSRCYIIASEVNRGNGIAVCDAKDEADALSRSDSTYKIRGTMDIEMVDNVIQRDVKVIKADVEGFEPLVLQGAKKLLTERKVWFLLIEYNKVMLSSVLAKLQPKTKRIDFVLDLMKMGYRVNNSTFKGPFWTESQVLAMDEEPEPIISNLYFVHPLVDLPPLVIEEEQGKKD